MIKTSFFGRFSRAVRLTPALLLAGCCLAARAGSPAPDTYPLNRTPEVQAGWDRFYNADYDAALARFQRVLQAHPSDPMAADYVLYTVIFRELSRLDLLDTTFYANDGFLTGKHTVVEDPAVRDQVKQLAGQAIAEADTRIDANSEDVHALYARGWARSLEATYIAMVERGFPTALRLALSAKNDHAEVLRLDPAYVDANLVVGIYEYVVGALPFSFRLVVGIAGIHGNKEKGMAMLRVAAAGGVTTSVEARTCIMLFLRREAQYDQALAIAQGLAAQYPHGFLFQLEEANLAKDAGQGTRAIDLYHHALTLAGQPGYFHAPHLELAYFGLGDTLRGQKLYQPAIAAYQSAASAPTTSPELKRRCLLAAGKAADLLGNHNQAEGLYRQVIAAGGDTVQADDARKLIRTAYTGH